MEKMTDLINDFKLYQEEDGFRFSVDAVILSDFISNIKNKKILEIGTGNGVIPILLYAKNKLFQSKYTGIEIQKKISELAQKNINYNKCEDTIEIINCDIKDFKKNNSYDVIISNPPYMVLDGKKLNEKDTKLISRHEICLTLEELIKNSKRLLKPRGEIYIVHRAYRIQEILTIFSKYNINVEKIRFVYHKKNENSNLVLVKGNKGIKRILKIEEPLYLEENM